MQRLQHRGENLYYTPLSDNKHHILIDDMNREKLESLIHDGYQPAVLLESSPGNYQAIITVLKLGTPHDRDVGNRLAECLNREYGDPKLSGCIHPHRAPGFENRKPVHRREDGSYPEVRLLKAERRECVKTLALSGQIDAEYQRQAALKAQKPRELAPEIGNAPGNAVEAYQRHYRDIRARMPQDVVFDCSRVDSMIAVRLRVTGHSEAEIRDTVRQCAPGIRDQAEGRNWNEYAQRTAAYAFSFQGDRQADSLSKYRQQWLAMEGRAERQEQNRQQVQERPGRSMGMGRWQ
jgi:hypothetical protein